ncbi:N-6 DNA methylase [Salinimicrobium sp. MT39]|uniref:site-specific DNA-methyltransferase (adenine-specific) n=1 Tax=Salinimicrobium profundisediminis TaxID=2994553 RepID=A0A9X3CXN1_9FLAO|nr:DNA methyltransferase [Salinimicrobium profundisediminis]MCX2838383.1 N-6 DNA methylase [Salinimicrobium profundisediminis]
MNQHVLKYLRQYSTNIRDINRLLVSSYLKVNDFQNISNELIKGYIINEDEEIDELNKFLDLFRNKLFTLEELIEFFEFVISPSDKIVNGAVYTPKYIRDYIVSESIANYENLEDLTACDIACGCGGFLFQYALKIHQITGKEFIQIIEQNLYGIDITGYSIERTKILLILLALSQGEDQEEIQFNLYKGDSLEFNWFENSQIIADNEGFDFIFSNPPYVGSSNLEEETKNLMKNWSVASTGKLDLYIPFFEIGLKWLKESGTLGYITVNNFYRSLNGRALRNYFSEKCFQFDLIDFGSEQVFKSRQTYTCICLISKRGGYLNYTSSKPENINELSERDFIKFEYSDLNDFIGWKLDDAKTKLNLERLENSGKKLGDLLSIRNGFATLRNKIYLFSPIREDDDWYYFEKDSTEYRVEKEICKDAIKPNILKNEVDLETFNEKIIFPYTIIDEKNVDLFQNSQNRKVKFIPENYFQENFPQAYKYLSNYKEELSKRDKGKREYEIWYAYGRTQALNINGLKLLFPYISNAPYFVYTNNQDLLFYNGYALVSENEEELLFIKKLLETDVFWYYIKYTSKPYSSGYFALAKNYVKNFSIPVFTDEEKWKFMNLNKRSAINKFLLNKYNIIDMEL